MFNLLLDELPTSVIVDGEAFPIRWQFGCMIMFELMMQENEFDDDNERVAWALNLFYDGPVPENTAEAIAQMIGFYAGDRPEHSRAKRGQSARRQKHVYSFDHDDEYIFSAFLQQYGVNLVERQDLHWYQFRAMLHALTDECMFSQIVKYRAMDTSRIKDAKLRQQYNELKALYALPLPKSEQEKIDELERILLGDGDLTKL